ncbi:hypothetical protein AWC19_27540 [Mycobacterium palustre]|uniref:Uncharacterized protein n=1 Tax=Mycobacterium palustre TaxID=153971 RepID=A0A1X1ZWK4_9MYCO|nr:hypothetical protein AWC19_27540 [Mycobacterium palustre]
MTPIDAAVFDEIVAAFDDQPRCGITTLQGRQCQRSAGWLVNVHGCEGRLMCGQHLSAWRSRALGTLPGGRCTLCGQLFARLDDACTITRL